MRPFLKEPRTSGGHWGCHGTGGSGKIGTGSGCDRRVLSIGGSCVPRRGRGGWGSGERVVIHVFLSGGGGVSPRSGLFCCLTATAAARVVAHGCSEGLGRRISYFLVL